MASACTAHHSLDLSAQLIITQSFLAPVTSSSASSNTAVLLAQISLSTSASARRRHTLQHASSHHVPLRVKSHIGNRPPPACSLNSPEFFPSASTADPSRVVTAQAHTCQNLSSKATILQLHPQEFNSRPACCCSRKLAAALAKPPCDIFSRETDSTHLAATRRIAQLSSRSEAPGKYTKSQGTMVLCLTLQV
jgi:hypothetical protein